MTNPVDFYHELLGNRELAEASHVMLEEELRRRNLVFGDRPLCTVLRPRFVTAPWLSRMERRIGRLMSAFGRVHRAAMSDPLLRAQFRLTDWEEQLMLADPGYASASPHGRLDCFTVDATDTLALTEYNAETPAGAGFNDLLSEAFAVLPVMRAFRQRFRVVPLPARPGVATIILDAWREFSGRWDRPRIANHACAWVTLNEATAAASRPRCGVTISRMSRSRGSGWWS